MSIVLDASALLAYLRDEPGAEVVAAAMEAAVPAVSTVNWIEIAQRVGDPRVLRDLGAVLEVVPLDQVVAEAAARLLAPTKHLGLSLADRVCLALAGVRAVPALTADRDWATVDLGIDVRLIR